MRFVSVYTKYEYRIVKANFLYQVFSNIRNWCFCGKYRQFFLVQVTNGKAPSSIRLISSQELETGKRIDEQKGCERLTLDETREHSIHIRSLYRSKIRGKERLKK